VRVRFTPSGRLHFLTAVAYIHQDDAAAARRFRVRTETMLNRLGRFPASGRVLAEFPDLPYREVVIAPYRFFYRLKDKTIWVVAVWHGAQLPRNPSG